MPYLTFSLKKKECEGKLCMSIKVTFLKDMNKTFMVKNNEWVSLIVLNYNLFWGKKKSFFEGRILLQKSLVCCYSLSPCCTAPI